MVEWKRHNFDIYVLSYCSDCVIYGYLHERLWYARVQLVK